MASTNHTGMSLFRQSWPMNATQQKLKISTICHPSPFNSESCWLVCGWVVNDGSQGLMPLDSIRNARGIVFIVNIPISTNLIALIPSFLVNILYHCLVHPFIFPLSLYLFWPERLQPFFFLIKVSSENIALGNWHFRNSLMGGHKSILMWNRNECNGREGETGEIWR